MFTTRVLVVAGLIRKTACGKSRHGFAQSQQLIKRAGRFPRDTTCGVGPQELARVRWRESVDEMGMLWLWLRSAVQMWRLKRYGAKSR